MRDLKEVLAENRDKYIEQLKNLVAIDTHDLGHGIDGGLEKEGQDYMIRLFEEMGAETTVDPMKEEDIVRCKELYQEGNLGHNQTDRYNVYARFKGNDAGRSLMFNSRRDACRRDRRMDQPSLQTGNQRRKDVRTRHGRHERRADGLCHGSAAVKGRGP